MGAQMGFANMDLKPRPNITEGKEDPDLAYWTRLSHAKKVANDYFLHGRVQRELPEQPQNPPKSLSALAWLSKEKSTLMIPITSPKAEGSFDVDMTLDLRRYGFEDTDSSQMFTVTQVPAYKG